MKAEDGKWRGKKHQIEIKEKPQRNLVVDEGGAKNKEYWATREQSDFQTSLPSAGED